MIKNETIDPDSLHSLKNHHLNGKRICLKVQLNIRNKQSGTVFNLHIQRPSESPAAVIDKHLGPASLRAPNLFKLLSTIKN